MITWIRLLANKNLVSSPYEGEAGRGDLCRYIFLTDASNIGAMFSVASAEEVLVCERVCDEVEVVGFGRIDRCFEGSFTWRSNGAWGQAKELIGVVGRIDT